MKGVDVKRPDKLPLADTTGSIVFEAYQVSDLCMDMERRGVLKEAANSNKGYARTAEDVLVERKDTQKVGPQVFKHILSKQYADAVHGAFVCTPVTADVRTRLHIWLFDTLVNTY